MSLLRLLENGTQVPRVKSIPLTESQGMSSTQIYERCIAQAYRAQRNLIKEGSTHDHLGAYAARQARKMLSMQGPFVVTPDLKAIKDLAIKKWNESFQSKLAEAKLDEMSAYDEAYKIMIKMMGDSATKVSGDRAEAVLNGGREVDVHYVRSVTTKFRVVIYNYHGEKYAAIEAPGRVVEVYVGGSSND